MAAPESDLVEQLKSSLWYAVGQIVDHETLNNNANATPQFIGGLTELVWEQIESAAKDLELFAKHAGRSTVNADDVMLLARRNGGLESILRGYLEELRKESGGPAAGKMGDRGKGRPKRA